MLPKKLPQPPPAPRIMAPQPEPPPLTHAAAYAAAHRSALASVTVEIILATPAWAEDVLATRNTRNRNMSANLIRRLREIIAGGRWQLNGEAIVFDRDGRLLNGQHRLFAIASSDTPVPVLVVRGVDPAAFSTFDQGKLRSRADVLSVPRSDGVDREKSTTVLAGALGYVYRWENGCLELHHRVPDNSEIVDLLDRHPGIRDSVTQSMSHSKRGVHSPSLFAALHYLFSRLDAPLAATFFERVWEGIGVVKDSTEAVLRRWLENRVGRTAGDMVSTAAVVIKCWNRLRRGEPAPGVLKFGDDEKFPEIL